MDFFEHQHVAQRKTGRLVALMVLAVLGIIALVYGVVVLVAIQQTGSPQRVAYLPLLGITAVGVLVVVLGGSLFKTAQLASGGGKSVALSLGGRRVEADTTDPDERRLLNVVEEMSIAAGCSVPAVYLLDHEQGINAFAAGWSLDDAVVGVTRGAVQQFSRDELQGVIAHEFSHILHGDMRINLRLIGIIFGILAISVIGATVMRSLSYARHGRSSRGGKDNGAAIIVALLLAGLALYVIGYVGVFFGRLIQAAVSRQREFLADASAVRYTRNPDGIADALKRLGGLAEGSKLNTAHAQEHSHLFFGQAVGSFFGKAFATHPPLAERIGRVQPSWDGKWLEHDPPQAERDPLEPASDPARTTPRRAAALSGLSALAGAAVAPTAIEQIGSPTPQHLAYAQRLIGALPGVVRTASQTSTGAAAVVLALLLDRRDAGVRQTQEAYLRDQVGGPVAVLALRLAEDVARLDTASFLPVLDLSLPALGRLHGQEVASLQRHVDALAEADGRLSLFEWAMGQVLWRKLSPPDPRIGSGKLRLRDVLSHVEALLRVLATVGGRDASATRKAFESGASRLGGIKPAWREDEALPLGRLTSAVDRLAQLSANDQKRVITACAAAVASDGEVTTGEVELMRAVAETMGVPVPPLLPGQRLV